MTITVDECVGCPPEMGCMGAACPNRNVERHVCDKCGEAAVYELNGEELCEDCAEDVINEAWNALSSEEKADLLDVSFKWLDN